MPSSKPQPGKSLAETYPELAAQADGWDPTTLTAGSNKRVGWKCELGHTWSSACGTRSGQGTGCPVCSNKMVLAGFNDVATTNPELAAQADGWEPTTLTAGSNKRVGWKCELGHTWSAVCCTRSKGDGCPYCSKHRVLAGFNDVATTNPELAAQADGWDPTTLTAGSDKKVGWKCELGHTWSTRLATRSKGSGCPYCSNHRVLAGFNDVATTNPELAAQADGWDPTTLSAGSDKKVGWKCHVGHKWNSKIVSRNAMGLGCPICSGQELLVGYNDLATTNPELAAQADGWDPTTLSAGSAKKVGWKCEHGHKWNSNVGSRNAMGLGCPICSGQELLVGYNDFSTTHPELAAKVAVGDPTTLSRGSRKRLTFRCEKQHLFEASVYNITNGKWCPYCAGQKVLDGFNDLATTHPNLAAQTDGWDPTTLVAGSPRRVKWICEEGHRWSSNLASRSRQGVGCPTCAKYGFDPNLNSFLYLVDHFDLHLFQIGITNFPDQRLKKHNRGGWEIIELRGPMDGHLTRKLETDCLHALEKRGAILGHKAGIDKFDGYSEAWTKASLNVTSIKQILDWVYEDEAK